MTLVRFSGSGFLDLGLLRTRPSYRAILLNDLVALACMAAAEMEGEEDEAAHTRGTFLPADHENWRNTTGTKNHQRRDDSSNR